jgi:hypothetical protein
MKLSYLAEVYNGHGREEKHYVHTIVDPEGIRDLALWKDLRTITLLISHRQEVGKEMTEEIRYNIGSKVADARAYAGYVRGHWGIENGLHWVLDVCFQEEYPFTLVVKIVFGAQNLPVPAGGPERS